MLLLIAVSAALPEARAVAQVADGPQPPAHLGAVDGSATLVREGREEEAVAGAPLVEGDTLRTANGRAEILLIDGSALYLDLRAVVDVQSAEILRLFEGQATVVVGDAGSSYRLDTPAASIRLDGAGEYRISVGSEDSGASPITELAVVRGSARIETDFGSLMVRTGERSRVGAGESPSYPQPFNSARWNDFDRWVQDRQDGRTASRSAAYLSPEIQAYAGAFDRYGTWGQLPDYGYVWYPTSVSAGWRPYYNGHWSHVGVYGYNWISRDQWGWPTHHYGSWGVHRGAWFWRPGRVWSAARVWWAVSPGYVGWCPLGFDGRPVFGFSGHSGYRNVGNPWSGWTMVARGSFGSRAHVGSIALDGRAIARDPSSAFVLQRTAPKAHAALPRSGWATARGSGVIAGAPRVGVGRAVQPRRGFGPPQATGGSRRAASGATRVERPPIGIAPIYPYMPNRRSASPYDNAARVASERRSNAVRQAVPRSVAPPRAMPSPYPKQFQSLTPQPARPSAGPSYSRTPGRLYDRRGGAAVSRGGVVALPRSGPTGGSMAAPRHLPSRQPRGAAPSIQPPHRAPAAPVGRGTAVPRSRS